MQHATDFEQQQPLKAPVTSTFAPPARPPQVPQPLYFVAAFAVFAGGVLAAIELSLSTFDPIDLVNSLYMLIFGSIMILFDLPMAAEGKVAMAQDAIARYCRFLTRQVGRGLWYIFLGVLAYGTLVDTNVSPLLGFLAGGFVFLLGVFTFAQAVGRSRKLDKVRRAIARTQVSPSQVFDQFALADRASGILRNEFHRLFVQYGESLDASELQFIYGALSLRGNAERALGVNEFAVWLEGGFVWL